MTVAGEHDSSHPASPPAGQEQDRHRPALQRFERATPNELWQMDFKGPKSWHQPVGPLSVLDDHSRYVIALEALGSTHAGPVRVRLEAGVCGVRGSAGDADGPRGAVVELGRACGGHHRIGAVADETRHTAVLERHRTSADARQGRALSRRAGTRARPSVDWVASRHSIGWTRYRWEHNHLRPHEALGMQTPASRWRPSLRRYDPNPPRWQYPEGAWVLKVDCQGKLDLRNTKWRIGRALAGEWVQVLEVEQRLQVYYCNTLIRELEPAIHRSTIVERWIPDGNP